MDKRLQSICKLGIDEAGQDRNPYPVPQGEPSDFAEPEFRQDMTDLLTRKRAGHAMKHILTGPAFDFWEEFTKAASYYPFHADAQLIVEHAGFYGDLAQRRRQEGDLILVELGTGSAHAAHHKTTPLLHAVKPDGYIGVDHSPTSLAIVTEIAHQVLPDMKIGVRLRNFDTQILNIPDNGLCIMAQFGSTAGNKEGFFGAPLPQQAMLASLQNYRRNLQAGDFLILGLDQNQNQTSLDECYSDPLNAKFAMATLDRVKEELQVSKAFSPSNFSYIRFWDKSNHLYGHGYVATKDHAFKIYGEESVWKKGDVVSYANSYKYPQAFLNDLYPRSGFKIIEIFPDAHRRMHHQVLQAV